MLNDTHSELSLEDAAQGFANQALHSDDAEKLITELYIEARARDTWKVLLRFCHVYQL